MASTTYVLRVGMELGFNVDVELAGISPERLVEACNKAAGVYATSAGGVEIVPPASRLRMFHLVARRDGVRVDVGNLEAIVKAEIVAARENIAATDPCKDCAAPALCAMLGNPCKERRAWLDAKGVPA